MWPKATRFGLEQIICPLIIFKICPKNLLIASSKLPFYVVVVPVLKENNAI
jgi:hypothetical protein